MEKEAIAICPLKLVNEIIGGKWKASIICILEDGKPVRYNEIHKKLPEITNMMLAQSLKSLEQYGIINRIQYDEMPVRVEYSLSNTGKSLLPIIYEINLWGKQYINEHPQYESHCEECKLAKKEE